MSDSKNAVVPTIPEYQTDQKNTSTEFEKFEPFPAYGLV